MKHKEVRLTLVVLESFVALTSIICGVGLAVGAIQFPLAWLQGFQTAHSSNETARLDKKRRFSFYVY